MDLKAAVDRYLLEVILPRKPKHRTLRKTKREWTLHLEHFGYDTPVAAITTRDVADWRYSQLARGLSGATVNRRQNDIRALLNKVKRWGHEVQAVEFDRIKEPPPQDRYLTDAEFKSLLMAAPPYLRELALFLAGTGARLREATELTWDYIDLSGGRGRVWFSRTKSGKPRGVPLPQDVTDMLRGMKPGGEYPFPYTHPHKAWRRVRARAGLPWVRLHDLRHYYASRLVRRGVPLYTVQKLLGHSTPALTQRYAVLREDDLERYVAVLD